MHKFVLQNYTNFKYINIPDLIKWHFILLGLWEASVKSAKYHMYRIMKNDCTIYEEVSTHLTQTEACLKCQAFDSDV